jgi:hypothetical protein
LFLFSVIRSNEAALSKLRSSTGAFVTLRMPRELPFGTSSGLALRELVPGEEILHVAGLFTSDKLSLEHHH